jgi:uncharacterized protein YutE (UPF0331/DUF86 family)
MVDRGRVAARIDELDGYLRELDQIKPRNRTEYEEIEKRRACERLLQISVETVVTICQLLVSGLRLGLPAEDNDLFEKLSNEGLISPELTETLKGMKGFRNILVHEYGKIDDALVFTFLMTRLDDFQSFRREVTAALQRIDT